MTAGPSTLTLLAGEFSRFEKKQLASGLTEDGVTCYCGLFLSAVPSKSAIRWWIERVWKEVCSGRTLVGALAFVRPPASSHFCLRNSFGRLGQQRRCPAKIFHTRSSATFWNWNKCKTLHWNPSISQICCSTVPPKGEKRRPRATDQARLCVCWPRHLQLVLSLMFQ